MSMAFVRNRMAALLLTALATRTCLTYAQPREIDYLFVSGEKSVYSVSPEGEVEEVVLCRDGLSFWAVSPTGFSAYGVGGRREGLGTFKSKERPALDAVALHFPPSKGIPEYWRDPAFRPDGSSIAFRSSSPGTAFSQIYLLTLGAVRRLTRFETAVITQLSWSPDGRRIAFYCDPTGRADPDFYTGDFELWVAEIEGAAKSLSRAGDADIFSAARYHRPLWSPDGNDIYFSNCPDSATRQVWCYVVAADGSREPKRVHRGVPCSISQDGRSLYVTSYERGGPGPASGIRTFCLDLKKSEVREMPGAIRWPKCSPTGQYIAFCTPNTAAITFATSDGLITNSVDLTGRVNPFGIQDWGQRVSWVRGGWRGADAHNPSGR
ncbi:MAG: hypothetical protein FJ279_28710 [Planctomycetes bacterium]|nr:hypothetical protein [Planctomycetota bacterium]